MPRATRCRERRVLGVRSGMACARGKRAVGVRSSAVGRGCRVAIQVPAGRSGSGCPCGGRLFAGEPGFMPPRDAAGCRGTPFRRRISRGFPGAPLQPLAPLTNWVSARSPMGHALLNCRPVPGSDRLLEAASLVVVMPCRCYLDSCEQQRANPMAGRRVHQRGEHALNLD